MYIIHFGNSYQNIAFILNRFGVFNQSYQELTILVDILTELKQR